MAPSALGIFEIINIRLLFSVTVIYTSWHLMVMCPQTWSQLLASQRKWRSCILHFNHLKIRQPHCQAGSSFWISAFRLPRWQKKGTNAMHVTSKSLLLLQQSKISERSQVTFIMHSFEFHGLKIRRSQAYIYKMQ